MNWHEQRSPSPFFFISFNLIIIDRIQRLKDARSEATKEIEDLKAQKNLEYQNFVAQVYNIIEHKKKGVCTTKGKRITEFSKTKKERGMVLVVDEVEWKIRYIGI